MEIQEFKGAGFAKQTRLVVSSPKPKHITSKQITVYVGKINQYMIDKKQYLRYLENHEPNDLLLHPHRPIYQPWSCWVSMGHPRNPSAFWFCILIASNGAAGWGSKLLVDEFWILWDGTFFVWISHSLSLSSLEPPRGINHCPLSVTS